MVTAPALFLKDLVHDGADALVFREFLFCERVGCGDGLDRQQQLTSLHSVPG
jgi:hypothetical protein